MNRFHTKYIWKVSRFLQAVLQVHLLSTREAGKRRGTGTGEGEGGGHLPQFGVSKSKSNIKIRDICRRCLGHAKPNQLTHIEKK